MTLFGVIYAVQQIHMLGMCNTNPIWNNSNQKIDKFQLVSKLVEITNIDRLLLLHIGILRKLINNNNKRFYAELAKCWLANV